MNCTLSFVSMSIIRCWTAEYDEYDSVIEKLDDMTHTDTQSTQVSRRYCSVDTMVPSYIIISLATPEMALSINTGD